ncbi:partitioning defective 3 homolog B-like [Notolabrus celidotus]|uniref:partitioning defective 3 homolog B-like n=1 Tax=Notolabrus celidotus TaxID=1203425 RepID=UPI00148FC8B1|nr:partitioning defective 3 homolog B-like [Notolabrus celidotus]
MKVTVTFGDTAVVVPCKAGWTVRDLIDQATRRYRRIVEKEVGGEGEKELRTGRDEVLWRTGLKDGGTAVKTHHLEYMDGGILDMDDMLSDLVEDRDRLVAMFDEVQRSRMDSPRESMSNGFSSATASPEPITYYPHLEYLEPDRGEIEVNEASLKASQPSSKAKASDPEVPSHGRAAPSGLGAVGGLMEADLTGWIHGGGFMGLTAG